MFTELEKTILLNLLEEVKNNSGDMFGCNFVRSRQYPLEDTPVTKKDITNLENKIKDYADND